MWFVGWQEMKLAEKNIDKNCHQQYKFVHLCATCRQNLDFLLENSFLVQKLYYISFILLNHKQIINFQSVILLNRFRKTIFQIFSNLVFQSLLFCAYLQMTITQC